METLFASFVVVSMLIGQRRNVPPPSSHVFTFTSPPHFRFGKMSVWRCLPWESVQKIVVICTSKGSLTQKRAEIIERLLLLFHAACLTRPTGIILLPPCSSHCSTWGISYCVVSRSNEDFVKTSREVLPLCVSPAVPVGDEGHLEGMVLLYEKFSTHIIVWEHS